MAKTFDPWDAPDILEPLAGKGSFDRQWSGFLRDCALVLLQNLPSEVAEWVIAADAFERGDLRLRQLEAVRGTAWTFHDAREKSAPLSELSGIRAVMWRLWSPEKRDRWYESAHHFLHFCEDAGLEADRWWPLLKARFNDVFGEYP